MKQSYSVLATGVWISSILFYSAAQDLPEFLISCKNDMNLSNCSRLVLENLRPHLAKGIPQLQVPSIDPLIIPEMTRVQRNSKIANYRLNATNLRWIGVKDFEVAEIAIDPVKLTFRLKLGFPMLHFECAADLDGVILGFKVIEEGMFLGHYTNVYVGVVLSGRKYTREGKVYIKWEKEDIETSYDDVYFSQIHGLFADPTITQIFRIALNRSGRLLGTSFRAAVDVTIGNFIVEVINRVHMLFPKDKLY